MATASGIRAGAAYIELAVDSSPMMRGLRAASAELDRFGSGLAALGAGMTAVGGAAVAPLAAAATAFASSGDEIAKASERTGFSAEAISELAFAAKLAGTNFEDLETGIKNMQRAVGAGTPGLGAMAGRLSVLGLSAGALAELSPEKQFEAVADAISRIADPTARAAAAVEIFGRSGTRLIPLMASMRALRAEARDLGIGWTAEEAKSAVRLKDAMTRLQSVAARLFETVGGALAPAMSEWGDALSGLLGRLRTWTVGNARLIVSLAAVGGAILAAGAAVTALGLALKAAGMALGAVAAVVSAFLSPWALLGAAVAAAGMRLIGYSDVGARALSALGERFDALYDAAASVLGGIKDALAAGDIALAGRIFWGALLVAWQTGLNALRGCWLGFKAWFLRQTDAMFTGAASLAVEAWIGLARIWVRVINAMQEVSDAFVSGLARAWDDLGTWVAKRWTGILALMDSTVNVETTNRRLEQERQRRGIEIAQRSADITLGGLAKIRALDEDRKRALAAVVEIAEAERSEREAGYDAERAAAETSLTAARRELELAVEEARAAAEKARAERAGRLAEAAEAPGATPAAALSRSTMDVMGAFAGMFERIGIGASAMDRVAAATEETARNTRPLRCQTGLLFE